MRIIDIIIKKRSGSILTKEEIDFVINGYVADRIPDYQMASLLMTIWFKGMNKQETTDLTLAMTESGDQVDLSGISGIKVDKHSTGGVADTTTLIVGPLVAACGGKVAKMSGRGLGHTGGTLDKLESIPGFSVNQTMKRFKEIVLQCGLSVIGQTANLAPADKKLYALRDVTCTIDNLSLIAGSIMSKKLAAGSDAIVLDVKTGSGAFMKDTKSAGDLARIMVDIGTLAGRKTVALVTDMNQPLGNAVGNAIEVQEAVEILRGDHPGDLKEVSIALAKQMLILSDICTSSQEADVLVKKAVSSGEALKRFGSMIKAQGGDCRITEDSSLLPKAQKLIPVVSEKAGYLSKIDNYEIGIAALLLGAGRSVKTDRIDPAVGIWMKKRLGNYVNAGENLAVFHVNSGKNLEESVNRFKGALTVSADKPELLPLIYGEIKPDTAQY